MVFALGALGVLLASHASLIAFLETYMYYTQSLYVLVGLLVLPAGHAVLTISSPRPSSGGSAAENSFAGSHSDGVTAPSTLSDVSAASLDPACYSSASGSGESGTRQRHGRRLIPGVRAPRISIQLTPLPRVTLEFENGRRRTRGDASKPPRWQPGTGCTASLRGAAAVALSGCSFDEQLEPLPSPSLRGAWLQGDWPAQQRAFGVGACEAGLVSPFAAAVMGEIEAADASAVVVDGRELSGVRAAPCEATSSLGTDDLPADCGGALAGAVSETHLLQFGAMLGEPSCREALARAEAAGPVGSSSGSLYGSSDTDAFYGPWEAIVHEAAPGLRYWGWRRPLRRGLYMYMTRSVFLGVTPPELRAFMMDDGCRTTWDKSMAQLSPALAGARGGCDRAQRESDVLLAAVRFPKPLGQRSYVYARRVWARACDGGCYVLAKACPPPTGGAPPPRGVPVQDYASGAVIRAPPAAVLGGHSGAAAEVLMIYFEDSHVRAGFANLGIKKGLWPMLQRTDKALRTYVQTGGVVAACTRGSSTACTPRTGPLDTPQQQQQNQRAGAEEKEWAGVGLLRAAAQALRSLTAAAGALWEAHARVASLLPRMELRVLRWLLSRLWLGASSGFTFGRLSAPQLMGAAAAAGGQGSALRSRPVPLQRVDSHPLADWTAVAAAASAAGLRPQPAPAPQARAAAVPGTAASAAACAPLASALVRVGSHPLSLEDAAAHWDHSAPPAEGRGEPATRNGGGGAAVCWAEDEPPSPPGGDWPVARFLAASALERRERSARGYAASCPAGSCGASDASGPGSVGGASCEPRGRQRRRRGSGLVVRLMQAASVRVAHKLLSSLDLH